MFAKLGLVSFIASCCICTFVMADSGERSLGGRLLPLPAIQPAARPKTVYRVRSDGGNYETDGPARYQFAYQLRAGGPTRVYGYGAGGDSRESYTQDGASADFGHSEARDGARTSGKYFVQLPDGRVKTVEYVVEGKSGFVAKVSYDGHSAERPTQEYSRY